MPDVKVWRTWNLCVVGAQFRFKAGHNRSYRFDRYKRDTFRFGKKLGNRYLNRRIRLRSKHIYVSIATAILIAAWFCRHCVSFAWLAVTAS